VQELRRDDIRRDPAKVDLMPTGWTVNEHAESFSVHDATRQASLWK